jgi:hypothetical protein
MHIHEYKHACIDTCMNTNMHTYTYMNTNIHACSRHLYAVTCVLTGASVCLV